MAILAGFFSSKKDKRKQDSAVSVTSSFASDFDTESLAGTEYDPCSPPQTYPNAPYLNAAASSSKLKLPFRRKKSTIAQPPTSPEPTRSDHSPRYSATRSEVAIDSVHPPPSRSSLFSAYVDGSRSTGSLPSPTHARSDSNDSTRTAIAPQSSTKPGGIFSWARERKKSKAPSPPSREEIDTSFNLKAFRHVRVDSPLNLSETGLSSPHSLSIPPARPRLRGDSTTSDSSQRISVAAFREMQARRSTASSPTPPNSTRTTPIADNFIRAGSPNLKPPQPTLPSGTSQSSLHQSTPPRVPRPAPRKSILCSSSSSDTSSEESDSDDEPLGYPRSNLKAKSELGHGSSSMQSPTTAKNSSRLPVRKSTGSMRVRAPGPVSSLPSNTSAKQATTSNKANPSRPIKKDSDASSSSAYSDDDAPLASLVQPHRPGSALSTGSNRTLSSKPLIDINSLTKPPSVNPSAPVASAMPSAIPKKAALSPTNVSDRLANLAQGINSKPPLSRAGGVGESDNRNGEKGSPLARRTPSRATTTPDSQITRKSIITSSPPVASKEHRTSSSLDSLSTGRGTESFASSPSTAISTTIRAISATSSSSLEKVEYQPPVGPKRASLCLDDTSTPIIPTPIHHRTPPSGFHVTSRPDPLSRQSDSTVSHKPQQAQENSTNIQDSFPDLTQFSYIDPDKLPLDLDPPQSSDAIKSTTSTTSSTIHAINSSSATQPFPSKMSPVSSATQSSTSAAARKKSSILISAIPGPSLLTKKSAATPSTKQNTSSGVNTVTFASTSKSTPPSSRPKTIPSGSTVPDSLPKSSMPLKPFASSSVVRGNSPASSTGDSSSGRGAPVTPRDGSEIESEVGGRGSGGWFGGRAPGNAAGGVSGWKAGHRKSASYDSGIKDAVGPLVDEEVKRRDRRRGEAKNAIELGNVMNRPVRLNDDNGELNTGMGMGMDPRTGMFNSMMGMGMGITSPNIAVGMTGNSQMSWLPSVPSPPQGPLMQQFTIPQPPSNVDPRFLAAHQQAMMVAKQAYQYAVAQQAMAAAADEWERGSSASFMTGSRSGWGSATGSMMFPPTPRSMYAGSGYGGSEVGGGWGSNSVYGESYGPAPGARNRAPGFHNGHLNGHLNTPPKSESASQFARASAPPSRPGPRQRTKTAPSEGSGGARFAAAAQEQARARGRTPPPPSSWKRQQDED